MKLGLITMVRDEIDIIALFLSHIDALFDFVWIVDHQSQDGTSELLKKAASEHPTWFYHFLEAKTKMHAAVSNFMLPLAFQQDIDYLFFLDADEFIQIHSKEALQGILTSFEDLPGTRYLQWKNCIPDSFSDTPFNLQSRLWIPPILSTHRKIIVSRKIYEKYAGHLKVSTGNHVLSLQNDKEIPGTGIGTLYHIPIRSRQQAICKVIRTVIAYRGYRVRKNGESFQYYRMLEKIAADTVTDDDLRGFVVGFEDPAQELFKLSIPDLQQLDYQMITLKQTEIAASNEFAVDLAIVPVPFEKMIAYALYDLEVNLSRDVSLELKENILTVAGSDSNRDSVLPREKLEQMNPEEIAFEIHGRDAQIKTLQQELDYFRTSKKWLLFQVIKNILYKTKQQ